MIDPSRFFRRWRRPDPGAGPATPQPPEVPVGGAAGRDRLDGLVREARRDLSPWTPTPEDRVAWIAARCGTAEIAAAIARLDDLSRARDALPGWDGDSQDDIAQAQALFGQILARLPPRHAGEVAAALDSPEWGTRLHAASALAAQGRTALPALRRAAAAETELPVRELLARLVAALEGQDGSSLPGKPKVSTCPLHHAAHGPPPPPRGGGGGRSCR